MAARRDNQGSLFGAAPALPAGFVYRPEVLAPGEEQELLSHVRELPFQEFQFQGYVGKRRVVSFGWQYDFNQRVLRKADDIPAFLLSLREVAARFADLPPPRLQQVLVTEYAAGAGIGWHRDKAVFGEVIGISLLSACRFRLRRKVGTTWERVSLMAEPRSAYLLSGSARTEWEHSIPEVDTLRYSITFRNFRET
ncbi:MAG TPA: alpha-ketoglutarate-dependent dioxygenase AlkB [Gemmatimonadales bacterium]|nr:alpha-ketoglutarate-dependent dioxygenase AlkB [Gemmatimonadales bacterium]